MFETIKNLFKANSLKDKVDRLERINKELNAKIDNTSFIFNEHMNKVFGNQYVRVESEGSNIYAICEKVELGITKYDIIVMMHIKDVDTHAVSLRCFTLEEFNSNVSIISAFQAKTKESYADLIDKANEEFMKNRPIKAKKNAKPAKKEDAQENAPMNEQSNKKRKSVKPKNNK